MERRLLIVDELTGFPSAALIDALARRGDEVILLDHKTEGDTDMAIMNRRLLAAALMSGVVVATGAHGQQVPAHIAAAGVEDFNDRRSGKGKPGRSKRCNAAALKRAKAKRCNIAKRNKSACNRQPKWQTRGKRA